MIFMIIFVMIFFQLNWAPEAPPNIYKARVLLDSFCDVHMTTLQLNLKS